MGDIGSLQGCHGPMIRRIQELAQVVCEKSVELSVKTFVFYFPSHTPASPTRSPGLCPREESIPLMVDVKGY